MHPMPDYFVYEAQTPFVTITNFASGFNRSIGPMTFASSFGRFDLIDKGLLLWKRSSLMTMSPQDKSSLATSTMIHRIQLECPMGDCHACELYVILLSQDLNGEMSCPPVAATWNRHSDTPNIIESTQHGMLLNLFSTSHMTKPKFSILQCLFNTPTLTCSSLTANAQIVYAVKDE